MRASWRAVASAVLLSTLLLPMLPLQASWIVVPASAQLGLVPGDAIWNELLPGYVGQAEWSPDGSMIAVALTTERRIRLYDDTGTVVLSAPLPGGPTALEWRPDGNYIAVAASSKLLLVSASNLDVVWEKDLGARVNDVAWDPEGRYVAAVTEGGELFVYDFGGGILYLKEEPTIPALTVDWSPDGSLIVVGDGQGYLFIYPFRRITDVQSLPPKGEPIFSVRWSPDGQILAVAGERTLWLYLRAANNSLQLYATVDAGTRGQIAWSPCGSTLVVPYHDRLVVVTREGVVLREIPSPGTYPVENAHWNPADFSRLIVTGNDLITGTAMMYNVFSGALYTVIAKPPVQEVCYVGVCGQSVRVSADTRPTNVTLLVEAESLTGDRPRPAQVLLQLWPMPFQTLNLDASNAITTPAFNVSVEGDNALVSVLRPPEAILTVSSGDIAKTVESIAVLLPPGVYEFNLTLEKPDNYLGPEWVLVKRFEDVLPPGMVKIYNYTWFTLSSVTGTMIVNTEPEATLSLVWPNETVETTVEAGTAEYTVPAGSYQYEITLPLSDDTLVSNLGVLVKMAPLQVFPGDTVRVSFTYLDVLGLLVVEGPQGAQVSIEGPNGISRDETLDTTQARYYAEPGTYTITLVPEKPPHWLGPQPPRAQLTVEVKQGEESVANFFYLGEVLQYVQMVEQATNVTVTAPPGYIVQVDYNGTTHRFSVGDEGILWFLVPPGNLTVSLVDPQQNVALDEEKTIVTGGETIQLELTIPQQPGFQQVFTPEQPEDTGRTKIIIALAVIIPLVIGAVAYTFLTRRAKTPF